MPATPPAAASDGLAAEPQPAAPIPTTQNLDHGLPDTSGAPGTGRHHPLIHHRKARASRAILRRWRDLKAIYLDHRVDPIFREEIMVAVAASNTSRQCSFAHRAWARAEGTPEEELAALEAMDASKFDARRWVAFTWAQAAARSDFTHVPEAIQAEFEQAYGPQERADIELLARTMYWLNETSNGADAAWARMTGSPAEGSVMRDVEALALYALLVPYVLAIVSAKGRQTPTDLIRGMRPFFREFEARKL